MTESGGFGSKVPASEVSVSFGDVQGSQLVFGDNNVIQTPEGAKVTVMHVGERPAPRLRALPLSYSGGGGDLVGRQDQVRLAAAATAESPLQVYGRSGVGKTTLLKAVAGQPVDAAEGVVLLSARRRDLDEIAAKLYTAFWDCSPPYLPTPAEIGQYLSDRDAVIVLDDCGLDRDDVEALLDMAPRSTFVLAGEEQTLWARGSSYPLPGLDPRAGAELLERRLGRRLDGDERAAAERLSARVDGEPQRLVEAAAAISGGHATLAALAGGEDGDAPLTDADRRMVATLRLLDGAALGTERIAEVAQVPDAGERLAQLEQHGWVKSASPRYRLVCEPSPDAAGSSNAGAGLLDRLLDDLTRWSGEQTSPAAVADEAEGIEATLARAAREGRWSQALTLARAAEPQLARAGEWVSWRRVLTTGLEGARVLGAETAEAQMLHQLGSLALCLGERDLARRQLGQALEIRERLGEGRAAELTRHNLDQLNGGGGKGGDTRGGDGDRGGGLRMPALGVGLAVLAAVVALIALAGGGETSTTPAGDQSSQAGGGGRAAAEGGQGGTTGGSGSPGARAAAAKAGDKTGPEIAVSSPQEGATYTTRDEVAAAFSCDDAESEVEECLGTVANGDPVDLSEGSHVFEVSARDGAGNESSKQVGYTVVRPGEAASDTVKPDSGPPDTVSTDIVKPKPPPIVTAPPDNGPIVK